MSRRGVLALVLAVVMLQMASVAPARAGAEQGIAPVVVASKPFGESYVLAEMFAQLLESRGIAVTRIPGLGRTEITFGAVRRGDVDVYPEYTGTGLIAILRETLARPALAEPRRVFAHISDVFASRYGVLVLPRRERCVRAALPLLRAHGDPEEDHRPARPVAPGHAGEPASGRS